MSAQIKITVDGQVQQVAADQRPTHLFQDNAEIVVCKINGELKDLWSELSDGDVVESVAISSPDGLNVLRHSTAHVLAQAVQEAVSYTHLTLPTNRQVYIPAVAAAHKKKKMRKTQCGKGYIVLQDA